MPKLIIVFLLLLQFGSVIAQQDASTPFSLQEAIAYALKNHSSMDNAKLNVAEAKAKVKEVKSTALPQVNGSINLQHFLKQQATLLDPTAFGPPDTTGIETEPELIEVVFGTKNNIGASLDASQLLFNASYWVGLEAADLYVELAEKQIRSSVIDITDQVRKAYYLVLISKANQELVDKNISNVDKLLYETSQLYQNGFVEEIEVDRLTLSLSNLASQADNAYRQTQLAKTLLKFQMGYPIDEQILLTDELEFFVALAGENLDLDLQAQNRIELDLLDMQMELSELDAKAVRKQYLPTVNAFGSLATSFQSDKFDVFEDRWLPYSLVGLQVNIPIFDGFLKRSQIQQKEINRLKLANTREQIQQSIALEVAQSKIDYQTAAAQVKSQKANLTLAEKIYNVAIIKYKEGIGSSLEVSSSESQLHQTQAQYVKALYDLVIARSSLDKALGNL